jgi:hypothetical protein
MTPPGISSAAVAIDPAPTCATCPDFDRLSAALPLGRCAHPERAGWLMTADGSCPLYRPA